MFKRMLIVLTLTLVLIECCIASGVGNNFCLVRENTIYICLWVRSRWLDIGKVLFLRVIDQDKVEVHKHAKKRAWPISSHLDLTLGQ